MKDRISFISVLRLMATFSVVLLHTSAGVLDKGIVPEESYLPFAFYKVTGHCAVPVFILISGTLFLNPQKEVGYRILLSKYIRRIALALVAFGLPMCMMEKVFSEGWVG